MNYLALVNMCLRESGADLDSLSTFSGMNSLQTKMHAWVAQAWKEICMERDEWFYMNGKAVVPIYPRIYVENWIRAGGIPAAGATYESTETEWGFTLVDTDILFGTSITNVVSGAKAFIDIEDFETDTLPKLNEDFEELAPTPDATAFVYKSWGAYDFRTYTDTMVVNSVNITVTTVEPQPESFIIEDPDEPGTIVPLKYVQYNYFRDKYPGYAPENLGKPQVITITPNGFYDVWPRPEKEYTVSYDYSRAVYDLSATTDTPWLLPPEFHEIVVWKALMYYAYYDQKATLLKHATTRYNFFRNRMERRLMPEVTFGRNKFFGG